MKAVRFDADRIGQIAGTICAVHCVLTGLALGLLSVAGLGFLGSEPAEFGFIGVTVTVGLWALVHGIRRHHSWIPAMVFIGALGCIAGSHFVDHGTPLGTFLSVTGGIGLVTFHVVNQRLRHGCSCSHCQHGE
ncbi:MerC domain-containing protein [bacterium]|nr:MAG: MerC domain-containing protein [bacterium]